MTLQDDWLTELRARHASALSTPELTRAIRALSARYVESRAQLPDRSPLDSAGKRAAFAIFYAPLHFLTVRAIVRALDVSRTAVSSIVDLGCGTGVASAAWALQSRTPTSISGVDSSGWALTEASWTWRRLGLSGRTRRGDLVDGLDRASEATRRSSRSSGAIILGWSVNELDAGARARALAGIERAASLGHTIFVVEPIARRVSPWWDEWAAACARLGGRSDDWTFDEPLPASLAELNDAAGFGPRALSARSLWIPAGATRPSTR